MMEIHLLHITLAFRIWNPTISKKQGNKLLQDKSYHKSSQLQINLSSGYQILYCSAYYQIIIHRSSSPYIICYVNMSVQHQTQQLTNRTFINYQHINLNQTLLSHKADGSLCRKICKKIFPSRYKKTLTQLLQKYETQKESELQIKQMELVDDPVYTSARIQKKKPLLKIISELTHIFKVIQPETAWLIYWNMLICFIILYYFFQIGLVIFFGQPVWQAELNSPTTYTLNVVFIFILYCDILIQLNTGYYLQGVLIMNKLKVVEHYFKKYFVIDILSVFILTACFFSQEMILNYFKIIFYLKLVSLNKIDKIYQKMLVFYLKWNIIYLVFRQILIVVISTHYIGVIFFGIDYYVYQTNYYGPSTPNRCWIFTAQAYSQLIWQPWYVWYIYSFYWALGTMTTIAYGDITPTNPIDTIYVIFALVVCCIQFSYVLYNVIQILLLGRAAKSQQDNQNLQIHKYMKNNSIPNKLQIKVKAFIEQTWNAQMYRNRSIEAQMVKKLPKELRMQLFMEIYQKFAVQMLVFKYPASFYHQFIQLVEECRCSREEQVIARLQYPQNIYYVVNGKVDFYLNDKLHMKILSETSIGIIQYYTSQIHSFSVKALEDSNLYYVNIQKLEELIRSDAMTLQIMKHISDQSRSESRKCELFNTRCFICEQESHLCMSCPNSHYIIDPVYISRLYSKFRQSRCAFKRRSRRGITKKYYDQRRQSDFWRHPQISSKYNKTLNEIYKIDICQNLDFNNVQKFIDESLMLLREIEESLEKIQNKEEEWTVEELKNYQIYFQADNITSVLRKVNRP